jgi:hypothetical protein
MLIYSCKDSGASYDGVCVGTFSYTAFDTLGNVVVRGSLVLYNDNSRITGHWQFGGGQSGELKGTASDGAMALNLNPQFVDHNLLLRGNVSGNIYAGDWMQTGIAGVMAKGTFLAIRE